jgi:hypothetical protein
MGIKCDILNLEEVTRIDFSEVKGKNKKSIIKTIIKVITDSIVISEKKQLIFKELLAIRIIIYKIALLVFFSSINRLLE